MTKYFECPVCIDQDKKWEELYEDEVDLRQHITEVHARVELVEYIMEREHPYDIDDEENLTRRKIVKSSSSVRKTSEFPLETGSCVSEENIRRIVRDEMNKV